MTPEEFDLRVGFPPEEEPGFHAPGGPDRPDSDPTLIGLPPTPANVEALRATGAMEDFKEEIFLNEAARLRLFVQAAKSEMAERKLALARSKPKSNPLADALRVVADAARARGGKLWPSVRDAMLRSFEDGEELVGGLEVTEITGTGFADAYSKADLAGIDITFRLPDTTEKTISGATTYNYIMRK